MILMFELLGNTPPGEHQKSRFLQVWVKCWNTLKIYQKCRPSKCYSLEFWRNYNPETFNYIFKMCFVRGDLYFSWLLVIFLGGLIKSVYWILFRWPHFVLSSEFISLWLWEVFSKGRNKIQYTDFSRSIEVNLTKCITILQELRIATWVRLWFSDFFYFLFYPSQDLE